MKERSSSEIRTVWAYLHGELTDDERRLFERRMQKDAELRWLYADTTRMDSVLRETIPALETADCSVDALVEEALSVWEQSSSGDAEKSEVGGNVRVGNAGVYKLNRGLSTSKWWKILSHPALGFGILAAAAVIMLALPGLHGSVSLRWAKVEFTPLNLRGRHSTAYDNGLTEEVAVRCRQLLKVKLERELAGRNLGSLPPMTASLQLRELRDGAFSLTVKIRTQSGVSVGFWSGDYSGEALFREQAGSSVAVMADDLAAWLDSYEGEDQ